MVIYYLHILLRIILQPMIAAAMKKQMAMSVGAQVEGVALVRRMDLS